MNCDKYKLDSENNPIKCESYDEYYDWHRKQPAGICTPIGLRVGWKEENGVKVSTVYLGSDHRWEGDLPVLWETMVFGVDSDEWCERYTSYADAVAGHEAACKKFLKNEVAK